jgi:MoaA/NifB/PqqE/SkfB family radical SAM enzyme
MTYKQDPPFCIQVELCEGCNLYCNFCGLQGIRTKTDKTFKQMTVKHAAQIAEQVHAHGWNPRIEFAMHGEPTMNENYIEIVATFRSWLPKVQLMMTSNGGGLLRPPGVVISLNELFDAGLNIFAFDAYEYVKIKDKVDEQIFDPPNKHCRFDVHRYPDEKEFSPHNRYGHKARKFIRVQDITSAEGGVHATLNNHCGNGSAPLAEPIVARCAKPFRELSIRYNGNVAVCCNDWTGIYKCGNVINDGLMEVWHGAAMGAARRYLVRGERKSLSPCDVCDAKSYRVGLLPDKFGKQTLPRPNKQSAEAARIATAGRPYAKPVIPQYQLEENNDASVSRP